MALRMGGEAPHLGLVLTEGSLCGYSVERNQIEERCGSNDRGDFILHPSPVNMLAPGESFSVAWTLFWHDGVEDFLFETHKIYRKLNFKKVFAEIFTKSDLLSIKNLPI